MMTTTMMTMTKRVVDRWKGETERNKIFCKFLRLVHKLPSDMEHDVLVLCLVTLSVFYFSAYDPTEYEHLAVTPEIKEFFSYITRYVRHIGVRVVK